MKTAWTELSVEKLEEIADYIAIDNQSSAKNWVVSIQKSVNKLNIFPELGRIVPEIGRNDIRELIEGNYRIIYKREKNRITILTIRNFSQLLSESDIYTTNKLA
ncbi:MAG: type II toxin-antitoxin system RelE/ParE family toxin [Melioribacteraceae bacterium]|nr:type II toxin-antitoxin system RelE/ParE family toxin [Melioribacteraceae bacterium]